MQYPRLYDWTESEKYRPPAWHRCEAVARYYYSLECERGSCYDAIDPTRVGEDYDERVEIKSWVRRRADGSNGCVEIWRDQLLGLAWNSRVAVVVYNRSYRVIAIGMIRVVNIGRHGTLHFRSDHPSMGSGFIRVIDWEELVGDRVQEPFMNGEYGYPDYPNEIRGSEYDDGTG